MNEDQLIARAVAELERRIRTRGLYAQHADLHTAGGPDYLQPALTIVAGNGISVSGGTIALAPLTAQWNQTGVFDIVSAGRISSRNGTGTNPFLIDVAGSSINNLAAFMMDGSSLAGGLLFSAHSSSVPTLVAPWLYLAKSHGTHDAPTAVANNDALGGLKIHAHDGTHYYEVAGIKCFVDGVTGTGDLPTRLVLYVSPDGGVTLTEAMRISNTLIITMPGSLSVTGQVGGSILVPAGLTGATAASRYVGATASGAPLSGTFAVGDYIIDQTGALYICTVAGTPGTWVAVGAGGSAHNILSATHSDSLAGSVALGDIVHGNATPKWARLAGNTTTTKKFLTQTGNGTVSAAPAWDVPAHSDISTASMKQTLLLQGWQPTTTAGCAAGQKSERGTTNKHDIYSLAFDPTTAENAFIENSMPDNWDGGVVNFRVLWYAKTGYIATSSDGVAWTLKATSYADGDAIDAAYGTGVTVTDTGTANDQLRCTVVSADLTVAGAGAGELVHWVITRTVSDAADDWAADAELVSVVLEYGVSALSS